MTEILIAKLIDLALDAVSLGLERDAIVTKVKELEAQGAKPGEIADALQAMRDKAISEAQGAIDAARG